MGDADDVKGIIVFQQQKNCLWCGHRRLKYLVVWSNDVARNEVPCLVTGRASLSMAEKIWYGKKWMGFGFWLYFITLYLEVFVWFLE